MIARTAFGQMMDFLKNFPFVSKEEYLWEWNVAQIALATADATHIETKRDKKNGMVIDGTNMNKAGITIL